MEGRCRSFEVPSPAPKDIVTALSKMEAATMSRSLFTM